MLFYYLSSLLRRQQHPRGNLRDPSAATVQRPGNPAMGLPLGLILKNYCFLEGEIVIDHLGRQDCRRSSFKGTVL